VFTLPGHPEFIWASFEHTRGAPDAASVDGHRDLAPILVDSDLTHPVSMADGFALYKAGTPGNKANNSIKESDLHLDEVAQKFMDPNNPGMPAQTSIFRVFQGSKSNTNEPDQAITSLNHNVEAIFKKAGTDGMNILPPGDKRQFYRLVGGQWMDQPQFFHVDFPIQNDESNPYAQTPNSDADVAAGGYGVGLSKFKASIEKEGSDSQYSILAGEDRMSSTAMESFTQNAGNFNNCFTCHNTQAINTNGVPSVRQPGTAAKLLDPGLLNVSHIISQFVLEDCGSNVVMESTGARVSCN